MMVKWKKLGSTVDIKERRGNWPWHRPKRSREERRMIPLIETEEDNHSSEGKQAAPGSSSTPKRETYQHFHFLLLLV